MTRLLAMTLPALVVAVGAEAQPATHRAADEAAVRAVVARYVAARDARDAAAVERLLSADADQYTTAGEWRRGRDAVVAGTARSSAQNPGDRTIRVDAVRFLTDDVAIADGPYEITRTADGAGTGATAGADARAEAGARRMWTSLVLVRQTGEWRIAAIRNMRPTTTP